MCRAGRHASSGLVIDHGRALTIMGSVFAVSEFKWHDGG